mmetsp:Transcript_116696/g.250791  ORF Transcript_116696/g.250791 Transcript_116696/m.250791 type:complete len:114 (+) Transcript_116696:1-342(+)
MALRIGKTMSHLRLEDARASAASDKQMIDDLVLADMGSFDAINAKLRSRINNALGACQEATVREFQNLQMELEGSPCAHEAEELPAASPEPQLPGEVPGQLPGELPGQLADSE